MHFSPSQWNHWDCLCRTCYISLHVQLVCQFIILTAFQDQLETFILDGYVVVYSLTDKTSFETAVDIVDNLRQEVGPEKAVILVANKSDLVRKRTVSSEGTSMNKKVKQ